MSWSLMEVEGLCGVRLALKYVNNASEGNLVSVAGGWGGWYESSYLELKG